MRKVFLNIHSLTVFNIYSAYARLSSAESTILPQLVFCFLKTKKQPFLIPKKSIHVSSSPKKRMSLY